MASPSSLSIFDVETAGEAIRIAIAKTGERLTPDLSYVGITAAPQTCPHCGEEHEPAFLIADEALVALALEIELFNVESERHAEGVALSEIGQQLEGIPLDVVAVKLLDGEP